jgi:hypothetical protein
MKYFLLFLKVIIKIKINPTENPKTLIKVTVDIELFKNCCVKKIIENVRKNK